MLNELMSSLKRILATILTVLTPLFSWAFATDSLAKYDTEVRAALEKTDGYIKGVCHDNGEFDMLKDANIEWTRTDIPFPFLADGSISPSYLAWKNEAQSYVDNGMKVFAVTPYPYVFIENGIDPRDESSREKIRETARFYAEDLQGIVGAFQITNEMGIERFTYPLTLDEAAEFIGIQLEAMYPVRGDIIIGYNLAGLSIVEFPEKMSPWHQYCDYVGIDLYLGSFEDISNELEQYRAIIGFVRKATSKPIVICEFGYIGSSNNKTEAERTAVLNEYGYGSEAEAQADMDNFIQKLPPDIREEITELYPDYTAEQYAQLLFRGEYSSHFYRSIPDEYSLEGYDHSAEGQAKFYSDLIPRIMDLDYVIGTIIYCWQDEPECYVCGQSDCPVETGWGLVDLNGNPKPAYYAVQKAFAEN